MDFISYLQLFICAINLRNVDLLNKKFTTSKMLPLTRSCFIFFKRFEDSRIKYFSDAQYNYEMRHF